MKKIYFLFMMLACVFTASAQSWDGNTATLWVNGDGSDANPYLIEKPEHLAYLSKSVGEGESYDGKHFLLTTNLDMGGKEFPVIGKYDKSTDSETNVTTDESLYFKGIFDGGYHTIDNLLITKAPEATGSLNGQAMSLGGVALFACTTDGSLIKNMIIGANSKLNVEGDVVGSIIGVMEGGTLENSLNLGEVSAYTFAGGLVGTMTGSAMIRNSANRGNVTASGMICGGIVGQMEKTSSVISCYNRGVVAGSSFFVGGIAGIAYDQTTVNNSYCAAKVSGPSSFMGKPGAIVGERDNNSIVTENDYFIEALTTVADAKANAIAENELKSGDGVAKLNATLGTSAFTTDDDLKNDGFPILVWEKDVKTAIDKIAVDGQQFHIGQNTVVRNLSGQIVSIGSTITIQRPGIYLVSSPGQPTKKVVVK